MKNKIKKFLLIDIVKAIVLTIKKIFTKSVTIDIDNIKHTECSRTLYVVNRDKCVSCKLCVAICPSRAIKTKTNKIEIISELCAYCDLCKNICPFKAIQHKD